jgi:hypothetical protein
LPKKGLIQSEGKIVEFNYEDEEEEEDIDSLSFSSYGSE